MGKLLDFAKSVASEKSLHGRLGRWILEVSKALDDPATSPVSDVWDCPSTVAVNDVVYVSGVDQVDGADASAGSSKIPAIGFVTSKPTPTTAVVQYAGLLPNTFAGLVPGTAYYLGLSPGTIVPAGTLFPPGSTVQQVGVARSSSRMLATVLDAV